MIRTKHAIAKLDYSGTYVELQSVRQIESGSARVYYEIFANLDAKEPTLVFSALDEAKAAFARIVRIAMRED